MESNLNLSFSAQQTPLDIIKIKLPTFNIGSTVQLENLVELNGLLEHNQGLIKNEADRDFFESANKKIISFLENKETKLTIGAKHRVGILKT